MLITNGMQNIIRVLLNYKNKGFTTRELAKEANVSVGLTVKLLSSLAATGYIVKKPKIKLTSFKLLNAWAYTTSIKEISQLSFSAAERPEYLFKKISLIAAQNNLNYAFTLYSATEFVSPFVVPNTLDFYILNSDKEKWETSLVKHNIFPAEKGNITVYLVDKDYFYNLLEINGNKIISLPQLYVDLFSLGGRGEEAAQQLLKAMDKV
ncbi:hypothetical protein HY636_04325 [Candidatus Woesearchaeota archaeon]|nr:hypothetical protein [Candidatus Woesearchaeota archaeon]